MISDYMDMTFKKRRSPEKTTKECTDQEYEIMSFVVFRGGKSEKLENYATSNNNSVYEEYAC